MLVLTRKLSESVKIGNDVIITVTQIRNGKVKLGIEAPEELRIIRSELGELPDVHTGKSIPPKTTTPPTDHTIGNNPHSNQPLDFTTEYAVEIEEQGLCLETF
jgi:carbon storage regulator CsrA